MSKVKTEVTDDEDRNVTEFDEMEVSELQTEVTASVKSEIQSEVADDDNLKVTEFDEMEISELQTEVTDYALVKSKVQSEVTNVDDSIVTEFDEIEISEHQFKTEVPDDDDLKVTESDEMEVGELQLKIEVTDYALVKSEVQSEVTDVDHSKVTEFDEIEISEQQIKTEITDDDSEETEIGVEEHQVENKVTNDDDGETDVDESEIRELLEQKLHNIAIGSIRAKKSGPGSAWSPENNTYCGVLNCTSTTDSCQDLWFFKLPLHRHEPERRAKWLRKISRPDIETCHRLLVCGRHFASKDVAGSKSKKYLKKGVIPTLHLPAAHKIQKNLRKSSPKYVYKRTYKKVNETNETIDNDGPSTSGTQNVYRSKRPKKQTGDLETTITEKEVEASPTKNLETKREEKKELLLLSTLCNELDSRQLKTFLKYNFLQQKFAKEPYDKSKSSDELNLFILELYEEDPRYYEDLQYRLGLPPQSAPKSFTSEEHLNRSCMEHLNRSCIEHLVSQLKDMEMDKKNAILCIDIVKIKPHFYYDYELDVINGVDKKIAPYRYAIIAMARGMIADWYQIVSVHFCHDITSTTCHEYHSWANAIMVSLFKNNIHILTVVTSTDDFFVKAYSIKGKSIENVSSTKHYFYLNGKKVWHIFDPLHLKSCLYEELQENLFIFNDNFTADWMDVKEFYLRDKEREIGLSDISCALPPEGSQQDKLAAEILLRENTAAGILSFVDMNILREEARHTGVFLKILSESFSFVYPNSYNQTVTDNKTKKLLITKTELTKHKKFIKKMLQFFENIKRPKNGDIENEKFIKCSESSFRCILAILEETSLLKTIRLSNVSEMMQNFNLDPLVEFIDKIKVKNTKHLTSELLKETIQESLKQSKDPTFINFLLNDDDRMDNFKHIKKSNMSMISKDYLEYISNYSLTDGSNSLSSVSTYLLQKMYRKFSNFVSTRIKLLNSSVSFQHPASGSTGSVTPDDEFYDLVINMDTVFVDYWRKAVSSGKWFATMQEVMSKGITNVRYAAELPSIDFVRDLFIHIRIYQVVTYNNSLYEKERTDSELHKFTVNRLEGYKLEKKKVKLPCLDYHRNPKCTKI